MFGADAAIDHVGQSSTIVHAHVILVLEALNLGPRHTFRHRLVYYVYRVVHPWNGLGCVTHGERVHIRAKADELNNHFVNGLVLELAQFSSI